mmetsp:Transcript_54013/g.126761  ORF Transcript_54013/g.126761 Transcript_54013/m.126761 type:complete len:233 (-) Transcript_54013:997-1695(-)
MHFLHVIDKLDQVFLHKPHFCLHHLCFQVCCLTMELVATMKKLLQVDRAGLIEVQEVEKRGRIWDIYLQMGEVCKDGLMLESLLQDLASDATLRVFVDSLEQLMKLLQIILLLLQLFLHYHFSIVFARLKGGVYKHSSDNVDYGEQSKGNIEDVEQTPELPPAHGGQRVVVDVPVLSPGHCHVQGQYRAVQSAEVQLQGRVLGQLSHLKVVKIACNCLREGNTKHVEQSEQK